MLHIHHSNRLETLAANLLDSYENQATHPFTPRTIITENPSLARWLLHRFCLKQGIACLIDTPLPAAWLWKQAHQMLNIATEEDPLSRERMQWRIHEILMPDGAIASKPKMSVLAHYLQDDDTGLKCWQLAERIADCFDRYQYYRPELIEQWSAGQDPHWQAVLWREISNDIDTSRVTLINRFLDLLHSEKQSSHLPQRIDLFSIHNLPPLLLKTYLTIARHIPVHLWLLSPTAEYWADLSAPRELAQKRLHEPENADYWQAGNPLLTQWGRQGQAFQDLLLNYELVDNDDDGHFHEPARNSLLGHLQADIFAAVDKPDAKPISVAEAELASLQIHICHSPMRECQVLHDTLLHCLKADPALEPEDILVLVPELSRYAPYIEAVFGRTPGKDETKLPFNLSDMVTVDEHPLVRTFLTLLELPESRFTRAEILSLINLPEVCRHFGLTQDDHTWLSEIFDELRIYWGLDGKDKQTRFKLPAIEDNTWHQGFRRIMAGFGLGSPHIYNDSHGDIAPQANITAQGAERAARFFDLLHHLRSWSRRLQKAATASEWAERLARLMDTVFGEDHDENDRLIQIRQTLAELAEAGENSNTLLSLAVIRHWLNRTLSTRTDRGHFYSGGISFCGMQPLRGVPFKVVCLLGMQDQAFPRCQARLEFDLMAEKWRHGDPAPALEDRYLFLETLLAARDRFIISYTGRDSHSNEALQPSVVLQELLDYLDERYCIKDKPATATLIRVHPLQAFGRNNFSNTDHPGFDRWWLTMARTILEHHPRQPIESWPLICTHLPQDLQRQISPKALDKFFKHPIRHFVQQQLHIYEPRNIELIEDEPFDLNHLEQWQIRNQLLEYWLQGEEDKAQQRIKAQGMLPHGEPGNVALTELEVDLTRMLETLEFRPPLQHLPIDIDLTLTRNKEAWRMCGRLHHVYENTGLLLLSASKYNLANVLPLWIEHLCLHASKHPAAGTALFISRDASMQLQAIDADLAHQYLTDLVTLYEQGLSSPLPFVRKSAATWMESFAHNADPVRALNEAKKKWVGNHNYPGENQDFYASLILRGHNWIPDDDFAEYAQRILEPLYHCLEPLT